jgi:arylformamidase
MIVYEGDPAVHLERVAAIADGAQANVSRLDFGVHTGTHVDAPVHFLEGAPGSESIRVDTLIGAAEVVDATSADGNFDREALERLDIPDGTERVLLKTPNGRLWARSALEGSDGVPARAVLLDAR